MKTVGFFIPSVRHATCHLELAVKNKTQKTLILLLSVVVISSCTTPVKSTKIYTSTALSVADSLTGRIFGAANAYRVQMGVSPLLRHPGLDRLAQEHCEYLREHRGSFSIYGKNVSHFGFEGRALVAKMSFKMANCSENVASTKWRGKGTANYLIQMWISSKSHEAALRDSWTHTGIGAVVDKDGAVFSTQIFGVESSGQSAYNDSFGSRF